MKLRAQGKMQSRYKLLLASVLLFSSAVNASGGKLLGTGGVTSIDGAAGGGLTPWALISSYAESGEWGGTASVSQANVSDFRLDLAAASMSYNNRMEFSVARQTFDLPELIGGELKQTIYGAKFRVAGDVIYGRMPQLSVGIQYKENTTYAVPQAVGAVRDSDWEAYVAVSRAWLNGPFNRTWIVNGALRGTRANETGLLGFGSAENDDHEIMAEVSAGVFLHRSLAVGAEYRQKPDNLAFAKESDWTSLFVAWFPSKSLAITGAYLDLGEIAGLTGQDGFYLSLQGSF
ncbi:MAG: outer membrane protein of unknown function DUF3034 [Idiomarinaceae bacterium HL-53]|nr:MAG: outer membrane protein of unknown function DUF3034 [Idiomarinaceae bacterium HL-53]CUS48774.1 Protein of unknown function (DUF3034) [Idiomarinaceae bacterium HL-53]